jgi:hypothetical protein
VVELPVEGMGEVVRIEALSLSVGQTIHVAFDEENSHWRQGVLLATEGVLVAPGEVASPQLVLWTDTAPGTVELQCRATDGLLRFYNVWDSGRGQKLESQSATSGMLVTELEDGWRRYECRDIDTEPDFSKLVFRLKIK